MFCRVQGCQGRHGPGLPVQLSAEQAADTQRAREQYEAGRRRAQAVRSACKPSRSFGFGKEA